MNLLSVFIFLALIATVGTLITGVVSMGHGGAFDEKHSTQFMSARVIIQVFAIILMMLSLFLATT